ncbi:hypothetical protein ACRQ1B_28470 [Rhizobium panacihumi]|uniref:hypothetical protein n=1 Tax=Rhizobium panacihumi TaxID=2008450 RepID=UPI003D7BB73E
MVQSRRNPDDFTALENWAMHDAVSDPEITSLVLRLADRGVRLGAIEDVLKGALEDLLGNSTEPGNEQLGL